MKVLVCGGREFADAAALDATLSAVQERFGISEIIHGAARGADQLGGEWAAAHGVAVREFPADWQKDGRAAGPKRNARMLAEGQPDIVIAFPGGRGTAHMREIAQQGGIAVLGPKDGQALTLLSEGTAIIDINATGWPGDVDIGRGERRRWPVTSDVWFKGIDDKTGEPGIVHAVMVDLDEAQRCGITSSPPWPPIYAVNPSKTELSRLREIAGLVNAGVDFPEDRLFQPSITKNSDRSKPVNLANIHARLQAIFEQSHTSPARIETVDRFTRPMLKERPDVLFAFGDNMARSGRGGQAREARGEPNAVGIPTKHRPSMDADAFFTDADFAGVKGAIDEGFMRLASHLRDGGTVVLPADGFGTGLAELPTRAPKIHAYIERSTARLHEIALTQEQGQTMSRTQRGAEMNGSDRTNEFLVGRSDEGSGRGYQPRLGVARRTRSEQLSEGLGDAQQQEAEMATNHNIDRVEDMLDPLYVGSAPGDVMAAVAFGDAMDVISLREFVAEMRFSHPQLAEMAAALRQSGRYEVRKDSRKDRIPALVEVDQDVRAAAATVIGKYQGEMLLEQLGRSQATFGEKDIDRALQRAVGRGTDTAPIKAALMESSNLVTLAEAEDGSKRYGTMEYIRAEQDMWLAADRLASTSRHKGDLRRTEARMKASEAAQGWEFSGEQRGAVRELVGGPDLVILVGKAGAGKTTIMREAVEEWKAAGMDVRGAALAGIAADNLREETGADSSTVAKLLSVWEKRDDAKARIDAGDKSGFSYLSKTSELELRRNTVVVVDEAGMVDVMGNSKLMQRAAQAGAKMVLLGDPEQLASINAGAGLRGLVDRHGAVTLTKVVRQKDPEQRIASEALSVGNMRAGLGYYQDKGKIEFGAARDDAKAAMVGQYVERKLEEPGRSRVLLASTNADVADLNARARAALKEAGQLKGGVTVSSEAGDVEYAPGDRILFLNNDKGLGVFNGTRGTVAGIQVEGEAEERTVENAERLERARPGDRQPVALSISVKLDNGKEVTFDPAEYRDHAHANATTVYKSQGQTIDEVWQLADKQMYGREQAYVGGTRHRHDYHLHVGRKDFADFDALVAGASRSQGKDLANDFTDVLKVSVREDPEKKEAHESASGRPMSASPAPSNSVAGLADEASEDAEWEEVPWEKLDPVVRGIKADAALSGRRVELPETAPAELKAAATPHHVEASIASKDDVRGEAVGYARSASSVGPAIAESGRDKRGMVRFEWSDVTKAENDRRVAIMTTPDNYPAAKQALVERFQEIDPKGFSAWDKGGRQPVPALRSPQRGKGGGIGE